MRARRHRNRVHLLVARSAITKLISLNSYTHTISDHRFFFVLSVLNCISFFIICSSPSSCLQSSIENMVLISGQFCCCYFATAIVWLRLYKQKGERREKKGTLKIECKWIEMKRSTQVDNIHNLYTRKYNYSSWSLRTTRIQDEEARRVKSAISLFIATV